MIRNSTERFFDYCCDLRDAMLEEHLQPTRATRRLITERMQDCDSWVAEQELLRAIRDFFFPREEPKALQRSV